MGCLGPLVGYYSREVNPSGKRSLVFNKLHAHSGIKVEVPCGQCINCRIQKATDNAVRCMQEALSHETNCFVTLTYEDAKLPEDGSLDHRHVQLFIKRLRKYSDLKFKYFMCGEYGEKYNRPHYHLLLFGIDFVDKEYYKTVDNNKLYMSQKLEQLWGFGFCTIGALTFESARYCTGYIQKKITGHAADDHYAGHKPEYCVWSNGIGADYFEKFGKANYDGDYVVMNGTRFRIPRYYDKKLELLDSARYEVVKRRRRAAAALRDPDLANRRSWTREQVALARQKRFFTGGLDDS